ncbi:hypothetical protein AWW72_18100 [Acinetobacter sp. NRRL B-65365]|uniref:hypothetical protein n=1 Tax=Acinetobacter sp. NRRL B-65365 TaxID=1785092 RepID=UPI0007A0074D|nr:hypothetical protein [Acinetobacter sp. NRRL B-65365]KYQ82519.1 hypothetical protein AWW72_18100 [Acinetobacter sp. NRRL B-65365]
MNQTLALTKEQVEAKTTQFKKGNRVHVDFVSDSRTEFSGIHIKGDAVVDRHEDGYVYGQLELGTPFMCPEKFVQLTSQEIIKQLREEFENWIKSQDFYSSILIYQHGPELFIYDSIDGYKNLVIRVAFELWKVLHSCREQLKTLKVEGACHG